MTGDDRENSPGEQELLLRQVDEDDDTAELDLGYRGRGRPRLDPTLRRREKLVISLTADELRQIMLKAADDQPVPLGPNDWARRELLRLSAK